MYRTIDKGVPVIWLFMLALFPPALDLGVTQVVLAQQPDMEFRIPEVDDRVRRVEGFETADDAARAALDDAWERSRRASTRPDREPEFEFGGVIYRTNDGRFGYTTPRTDLDWDHPENERADPPTAESVDPSRGVVGKECIGDRCDYHLLTKDREPIVARYHIHPSAPITGAVMTQQSRVGPSTKDARNARDMGLSTYARGPDAASGYEPDGSSILLPSAEEVALVNKEIRERDFVCGDYEECDDGEERHEAQCRERHGLRTAAYHECVATPECVTYADAAVARQSQNADNNCGLTGDFWDETREEHLAWCKANTDPELLQERVAARDSMLEQCANRTAEQSACLRAAEWSGSELQVTQDFIDWYEEHHRLDSPTEVYNMAWYCRWHVEGAVAWRNKAEQGKSRNGCPTSEHLMMQAELCWDAMRSDLEKALNICSVPLCPQDWWSG